jgi:hypothetical protein
MKRNVGNGRDETGTVEQIRSNLVAALEPDALSKLPEVGCSMLHACMRVLVNCRYRIMNFGWAFCSTSWYYDAVPFHRIICSWYICASHFQILVNPSSSTYF